MIFFKDFGFLKYVYLYPNSCWEALARNFLWKDKLLARQLYCKDNYTCIINMLSDFVNPCISTSTKQVNCENNKQAIDYRLFCNGSPQCSDGSDEKQSYCNKIAVQVDFFFWHIKNIGQSLTLKLCSNTAFLFIILHVIFYLQLPFCLDPNKTPCPKNFAQCINFSDGCDNSPAPSCKGGDELTGWCSLLPTKVCTPSQYHCNSRNKAVCC